MILTASFAAVAVGALVFLSFRYFGPGGRIQEEKKRKEKRMSPDHDGAFEFVTNLRKNEADISDVQYFQDFLSQNSLTDKVVVLLRTKKWTISVSIFLLVSFVAGLLTFYFLRFVASPILAGVAGLIVMALPMLYLVYWRRRYIEKFSEHLPVALSMISGAIKSGHGLETAFETVEQSAPSPVSSEFGIVNSEVKLGVPLGTALWNLYSRIKSDDLKILITGISIHQELGGSLSEILDNLEGTIRERYSLRREISALSAQGRYSAWVLFLIPIVLVAFYFNNDREMFMDFVASSQGSSILWFVVIMDLVAFAWMRMVVKLTD